MANKKLKLILPGLLPRSWVEGVNSLTLCQILSKSSRGLGYKNFDEAISALSLVISDAPLRAWGAGFSQANNEYWCRVCFLATEVDHQTAYATTLIDLTNEENQALLASLVPFFRDVNLELQVTPDNEWYVRVTHSHQVSMTKANWVLGKSMHSYLPTGTDSGFWRRLFTECQMLLSTHSVNAIRMKQGKPVISCVWFDEIGSLSEHIVPIALPVSHALEPQSVLLSLDEQCSVLISSQFRDLVAQKNRSEYNTMFEKWDKEIWQPLWEQWLVGTWQSLDIEDCSGRAFHLGAYHRFYFWRKTQSLTYFSTDY